VKLLYSSSQVADLSLQLVGYEQQSEKD
jgi:hypothetical protein